MEYLQNVGLFCSDSYTLRQTFEQILITEMVSQKWIFKDYMSHIEEESFLQEYPVAYDQFDIHFYQVVEMFSEQKLDVSALDEDLRVLGLNSISFIKLIIALENEFNIEMDDEYLELENFTTLQHLKDSLRKCINYEIPNES
ncbi:hypothetical protein CXK86_21120 [Paenibacillus sp. BGI2013]|nr:hypothetical protein CXK86_21120 [Paenibacillus sp. BGI2013]